ncbi:unnamed protein product [Auanema sp. JU1783]|nr:unnamed protein product [Auanema sp. JU1783]
MGAGCSSALTQISQLQLEDRTMLYLNTTQELAILQLYSEEITKLLESIYENESLGKGFCSLLQAGHINNLRTLSDTKQLFSTQLWGDLFGSPLLKVLYETVLNFLKDVNENLHRCISLTSENVRTCSFGLVLQHIDKIMDLLDVTYVLNHLKKINKSYEHICSKLTESLKDVEKISLKKKIVIRTIPFFGKMACMDVLKALYDSSGSEFVESIQPGFLRIYEYQDAEREAPQSVVKFYPISVSACLNDITEGVIDVDLAWEDLPATGMKKCLWDILDQRSFNENPIVLRSYQKELARDAVSGKNCVVSAPTGSGKTIIAAHIVKEHILKRYGKSYYKVLFLVNSTPILVQQTSVINRFLEHKFQVGYTSGIQNDPVHILLETKDVLVCTPQIIVNLLWDAENGLNEGREPFSLSKFSLIIFDECHNTKKLSPYAELMQRYHSMKFTGRHNNLPQIVGLTASLGVGAKSKNLEEAVDHIVTTCAKLDCRIISQVKQNKSEMKDFVTQATDRIHKMEDSCHTRQQFLTIIKNFMILVEAKSRKLLEENDIDRNSLCVARLTDSQPFRIREVPCPTSEVYENFISCHLGLNIPESSIPGSVKKLITLYFEVLQSCCRAMDIHRNFSSSIALEALESDMEELLLSPELETLWKITSLNLKSSSTSSSQMIDRVVQLLESKSKQSADFRAIIFVKTRAGTMFLANILNNRAELKNNGIVSSALIGTNRQGTSEKINKSEQSEIIEKFTNGTSKVLVATSTAEEGLDILKCNLVIKYNYVTNEIAHVQRRGRGRAADAECVFITTCPLQQSREESNCMKEQLMSEALEYLQPHILERKVAIAVEDEIDSIRRRRALKAQRQKRNPSEIYTLCCSKCDKELCKSVDVKVYRENLYVVINPAILPNIKRSEIPEDVINENRYAGIANIYCKGSACGNELGKIHRIEEVDFPSLSAKAIIIKYVYANMEKREKKKKWSLICDLFQPSPLATYDFANMRKEAEKLSFNSRSLNDLVKFVSMS